MQFWPPCQNLSGRQSAKNFSKKFGSNFSSQNVEIYSFFVVFRLDKPLQTLFVAKLNVIFNFFEKKLILKNHSRLVKCISDNFAQLFSFKLWQNFKVFPKNYYAKNASADCSCFLDKHFVFHSLAFCETFHPYILPKNFLDRMSVVVWQTFRVVSSQ